MADHVRRQKQRFFAKTSFGKIFLTSERIPLLNNGRRDGGLKPVELLMLPELKKLRISRLLSERGSRSAFDLF